MERIRKASRLLSLAALVLAAVPASPAGEPSESDAAAAPFFQVHPNHKSTGEDREIQASAADLISRQAERERTVPDGRARHFAWIKMPIEGWIGEILDQAALPSGLRVRVRVYPFLGGGCCAVGSYLDETYLIRDGDVQLTTIEFGDRRSPRIITFN